MEKAARYYATMGHASFAPGNADGGLTTIEEKSLGAYAKKRQSPIAGLIKPGDIPPRGGLYLLDVVPDGEVRFGFPNITDNAEIVELIACGCQLILFTTGRGSVVGSAIAPVVKVCANPETFRRMAGDMDVDAGRILEGRATLDEVGREIFDLVLDVADGATTTSGEPGAPGVRADLQELRRARAGVPGAVMPGPGGTPVIAGGAPRRGPLPLARWVDFCREQPCRRLAITAPATPFRCHRPDSTPLLGSRHGHFRPHARIDTPRHPGRFGRGRRRRRRHLRQLWPHHGSPDRRRGKRPRAERRHPGRRRHRPGFGFRPVGQQPGPARSRRRPGGRQVGAATGRSQAFEYTVLLGGQQTITMVTDESGLRVGDCVSVERGAFNNLRLVDDARCANRSAPRASTGHPAGRLLHRRQGAAARGGNRRGLRPRRAAGAPALRLTMAVAAAPPPPVCAFGHAWTTPGRIGVASIADQCFGPCLA